MAGAGKGSKSGDVKESTDSSTTIEEDEKGKKKNMRSHCRCVSQPKRGQLYSRTTFCSKDLKVFSGVVLV